MNEFTVTEAAELLKVDRSTVWRWIDQGKIQARKAGLGDTAPYKISAAELKSVAEQLGLHIDTNG